MKSKLDEWSLRGSLLMLAALPVLALFGEHMIPVPSFYGEWLVLLAGLCGWLLALPVVWRVGTINIPHSVLLPLGLMAFIALQPLFLPQIIIQHAQMGMLYLLWASLLMGLVGLLIQQAGREQVATWLAVGLVWAAACATLRELGFRFEGVQGWWGGTAQANNYGDLLALGLASALYLLTRCRPAWRVSLIMLLALITLGLSMTPSRSVWLYGLSMLLIASLWQREQIKLLLLGFALYLLLQGFWAMDWLQGPATQTSAERLYQEVGGAPVRQHIWQVAWQIFTQAPWLGNGFGQFDWAYFQTGRHTSALVNRMEHAHNLFLQLLAELGVFPVFMLLGLIGRWLWQLLASLRANTGNPTSALQVWLLMLIAVLGIHNLLEYPLWFTGFLGIAAMILSLGDKQSWSLRIGKIGVLVISLLLVSGIAVAVVHQRQYSQMELALNAYIHNGTPRNFEHLMTACKQANRQAPLLTPYVAMIFATASNPADIQHRPELSVLTNLSYHFSPTKNLSYLQALMQALNQQPEAATVTLRLALAAYPSGAKKFLDDLNGLHSADRAKVEGLRRIVEQAIQK